MCKKIIIIQIKTSVQALLYRHLSNFSLTSATILKPSRGWTPCLRQVGKEYIDESVIAVCY